MTGGFGPADVLSGLAARLGDGLVAAGFGVVATGARMAWTLDAPGNAGQPLLGVHALVMEHPDDVPHGQSFTLALSVSGSDPTRIGFLMTPAQTLAIRDRERAVLRDLPRNDVTDYRLALLDRLGDDMRPRDQWLTAGCPADVTAWVDLLAEWLPAWAESAGASGAACATLRQAVASAASAG
jgi:hypothetical protein